MTIEVDYFAEEFDPRFRIFHDLMQKKVADILLVSTPYDAWIMDEDCRLYERIIHEYEGLNLSHPPRLHWVGSGEEALGEIDQKKFDMVITMPRVWGMDSFSLGQRIKEKDPEIPVIIMTHRIPPARECAPDGMLPAGIDRIFAWSGNTDILVALIKSAEDRLNAAHDTRAAGIRVILFVEDSPYYITSLLPMLYKELVTQTQAVLEEGLNEEHRLLTMRARPKILVAGSYEEAVSLYEQFEPYVLGVISDVRFSRNCERDDAAGVTFLKRIKQERFDIPLLLTSSDPENASKAKSIPAVFVDKNSPSLHEEVRSFFLDHLGFGEFVFRWPDGRELARAGNLRALEAGIRTIPSESFYHHCNHNDFSRWLFARTEIMLASKLRPITHADFSFDLENHRHYVLSIIRARRKQRQKGVVADFEADDFDPDTDFFKIGKGSLGGKARGLAFVSKLLHSSSALYEKYSAADILVPQTLVITTDAFDSFVETNKLKRLSNETLPDEIVAERFMAGRFPEWIKQDLRAYLGQITYPLAIRSSSLLEDAHAFAYAGLYRTYMISNDHPILEIRLAHLITAIKLVFASTYFQGPKAFSRRVGHRTEEEKMAVIVQRMEGDHYGGYFYPAISGVAQSHNFYPFSPAKAEDGIAAIALGLGKSVMEGEKVLRFSPRFPKHLPQHARVEDVLENAQQHFYALKLDGIPHSLTHNDEKSLVRRKIADAADELPMRLLAGTYAPEENRIKETTQIPGARVLTFSQVLKYNLIPLPGLLNDILKLGEEGMGCPVEIEFSVNLSHDSDRKPSFAVLQMRPMSAGAEFSALSLSAEERQRAFCYSKNALGHAKKEAVTDIVFVKPEVFSPTRTLDIAKEIGYLNNLLTTENKKYLLIGPGRWGSADRWLGIPVKWTDIFGVQAIIEASHPQMRADPSQGSHFFHNITTLGIPYITISDNQTDVLDWSRLTTPSVHRDLLFVTHVHPARPLTLKVDARRNECAVFHEM
ncbi:MAG: PEP/pyruvate-binding domain-containing protein [Desulfobacterales bacterium]|nr:PEP/pyruvate-binding domain-containing protein [Desulfobacterales bacterium]